MSSNINDELIEFYGILSELCCELSYTELDKKSMSDLSDRFFAKFNKLRTERDDLYDNDNTNAE